MIRPDVVVWDPELGAHIMHQPCCLGYPAYQKEPFGLETGIREATF